MQWTWGWKKSVTGLRVSGEMASVMRATANTNNAAKAAAAAHLRTFSCSMAGR